MYADRCIGPRTDGPKRMRWPRLAPHGYRKRYAKGQSEGQTDRLQTDASCFRCDAASTVAFTRCIRIHRWRSTGFRSGTIAGLSSRVVSASDCGVRGSRFESRR